MEARTYIYKEKKENKAKENLQENWSVASLEEQPRGKTRTREKFTKTFNSIQEYDSQEVQGIRGKKKLNTGTDPGSERRNGVN